MSAEPNSRLAALVLAAGYSSRMGDFKPLLSVGCAPALERAIDGLRAAGIADVTVVTGHRAEDLRPLLLRKAVREVFNPDFARGMFSSVTAGIRSLAPDVEACFVLPADVPLVREQTIRALAAAYHAEPAPVLYPVFQKRRGHPTLIRRDVLDAALGREPAGGLRGLLKLQAGVRDIPVDDEAILLDMDTPEDLARLREFDASCTASVCPVCLRRIGARRIVEGDDIYLVKSCPEHGRFRTILWRGLPSFQAWGGARRTPSHPSVCAAEIDRGCPFDCGLCPDHRQHTCCVVLEVTRRCNLACPVCFASAGGAAADPPFETIADRCRKLLASGGPYNLQLSGGEPTMRDDLPEVVAMARSLGFPFLQLNTNGLLLAADPDYAARLKDAGLSCVFLQFDGVTDEVYRVLRGRPLFDLKQAAIRNCAAQELGVVLVPTLVPRVNTNQIGALIRFAIAEMPAVRAVHFQPVSYFGRYPHPPADEDRITIPEVLRAIESQTGGRLCAGNFVPPSAESPWCSFQGKFIVEDDGTVRPVAAPASGCCAPLGELVQLGCGDGARRARQAVARQWSFPAESPASEVPAGVDVTSLDAFLAQGRHTLSVTGMAFQDVWNLDLERLRDCYLHASVGGSGLVPLCAYNLTASNGRALYRTVDPHA